MGFRVYRIVIVACFLACASFGRCFAQTSSYYQNVLRPILLADLDSATILPLKCITGQGVPDLKDSTGANILASDTGEGVICHIWSAIGQPDSTTWFRLWIDGAIVKQGPASLFYQGDSTGLFLTSFDSSASGGYDCDVQLPYRHSFRLTDAPAQGNIWFGVVWRPLPEGSVTTSVILPDSDLLRDELLASQIENTQTWDVSHGESKDTSVEIPSGSSSVVWSRIGPSVVTSFRITPDDRNTRLDSLWIQMFWNGSDSASVDAPLADFFGQGAGSVPINSIAISGSKDSGFECRFPMPFEYQAKMVIVNYSSDPVSISAHINVLDTALPWSTTGYFHAHFCETNPTRYGVYHPVLHWKGPGRFVGLNLSIPNNQTPCALEGNAVFTIDSIPGRSFEYTGTEDYFGAGFYFADGEFSHPFYGCTQKWFSFYRFNILDAIDFARTIDFDFQHGNNNDVSCDYRSVAYFYTDWQQSWVRCDTVLTGGLCTVYGSAYAPLQQLSVQIGDRSVATVTAGLDGSLRTSILVPNDLTPGNYSLIVADRQSCILHVLAHPALKVLSDSSNLRVSPGDSIAVVGWGFEPNSTPEFLLGEQAAVTRYLKIDSLGRLSANLVVPMLPPGQFVLEAKSENHRWSAEKAVTIAGGDWIEAEDMKIDTTFRGFVAPMNLCPWWNASWSKQEVLDFQPDAADAFFAAEFNIFRSGSYSLIVHGTNGPDFGNYRVILDNRDSAAIDITSTTYPPVPVEITTLRVKLDSGWHQAKFLYLGSTSNASNGALWLDALEFEPSTETVNSEPRNSIGEHIIQNPSSETISIIFETPASALQDVELYDVTGRKMGIARTVTHKIQTFSTVALPTGVYFLIVGHNMHKIAILR